MLHATLAALRAFPDRLEEHFAAVPASHIDWRPPSWEGIPSERLTALQQLCHVRDIEVDGYHVRLRRMLTEDAPTLASIDTDALVGERRYSEDDPRAVLAAIRAARSATIETVAALRADQLARTGTFEGYGRLTVKALIHYLCSHDQQHLAGLEWLLGQIDSARL
jgi:hypothetical protein